MDSLADRYVSLVCDEPKLLELCGDAIAFVSFVFLSEGHFMKTQRSVFSWIAMVEKRVIDTGRGQWVAFLHDSKAKWGHSTHRKHCNV